MILSSGEGIKSKRNLSKTIHNFIKSVHTYDYTITDDNKLNIATDKKNKLNNELFQENHIP